MDLLDEDHLLLTRLRAAERTDVFVACLVRHLSAEAQYLYPTARRVLPALDRILAAYQGATVLVVSHVTPIKTLICKAVLAPPAALFRIHLDLASLTEIDWFGDGPVLLRSLNDTAHLGERAR